MILLALAWLLFTLFLFTLENHWFLFFNTTQSPDLLLLFLLLYALDQGERRGAWYGLGIGALLDIVTFSYFGWHMVSRAALGYLVGRNRMNMFADRLPTYLILTGLVTLLLQVARGLFLCVALGRWLPLLPFVFLTLKSLAWNLVAAPVMWFLYHKLKKRVRSRMDYYYHL
ncbi:MULTISPECIES: rod shape-determining protein MreD [Acidaminococcus]|uniref:rod shape-determining protein MreD n=1 Tax=Acidaminococcus TaxID=904 RepID=UPI0008DAB65F|nr:MULTISPECIES: rod shape-determining protein MreD [Acidaminococcus]MDO5597590.1 rod shape-determining protein MreD [Acidaminococcus sp.]